MGREAAAAAAGGRGEDGLEVPGPMEIEIAGFHASKKTAVSEIRDASCGGQS